MRKFAYAAAAAATFAAVSPTLADLAMRRAALPAQE
jgi:hypothetical protein